MEATLARTFAPLRRLAVVLAVATTWIVSSVFIYNTMDRHNGFEDTPDGFFVVEVPKRVLSLDMGKIDWSLMLAAMLFVAVAMTVAAAICYGLYSLVRWIIYGRQTYVDPCQDSACPCARHAAVRDAEDMVMAAAVIAVSAATAATISNSN